MRPALSAVQPFVGDNPDTEPLADGLEAFCFLGFSALGLRTSLLVFFWLLAMVVLLWIDRAYTANTKQPNFTALYFRPV
jgi:hypothetical protein